MKRNHKKIVLLLTPLFLSACEADMDLSQRDVYTKMEDCVAEWGKVELCQKMADEDAKKAIASGVTPNNDSHFIFWGPSYFNGDRSVLYNGQRYAPSSYKPAKSFYTNQAFSNSAKVSPGTPFSAGKVGSGGGTRGGFGSSAGRASSGFSSGG